LDFAANPNYLTAIRLCLAAQKHPGVYFSSWVVITTLEETHDDEHRPTDGKTDARIPAETLARGRCGTCQGPGSRAAPPAAGLGKTDYGSAWRANISTLADYRRAFPVANYEEYRPVIQKVMAGEEKLLLWEDPVGWAITRGTTKGESKFIPMTATDLKMRVNAGRAMMKYVATTRRIDLFAGANLNLNFPSVVGRVMATG
jgi:hypothetical protein